MKATDITEKTIQKAHNELKALLQYDDKTVLLNKQRALSGIETAIQPLEELKLYINKL